MNYYNEIKDILVNNEITKKIKDYSKNKSDLDNYYQVGKLIIEAQGGEVKAKYGDNLIKEYSKKLTKELGKGYTISALKRMRQFFLITLKGATLSRQLTWSHYVELLKFDDMNIINYYVDITIKYNLGVRELREKIKSKEYERLDDTTKDKLIKHEETVVSDFIKNPILIKNPYNYDKVSEKTLIKLILEDIPTFLKELGNGFCFIDYEYKIKLGDKDNYIDILLFNYIHNCFVVVELKITELKKDHIGQVQVYMNYIDKHVKSIHHDKTIGIIIAKYDNKFILQYCSDDRIFASTYNLV